MANLFFISNILTTEMVNSRKYWPKFAKFAIRKRTHFPKSFFVLAAKFLHDNGILLHYNDILRELNTLFFIDPAWLCDMLAIVVTIPQRNPYVKGGYLNRKDLDVALKNPRLPVQFIPQVSGSILKRLRLNHLYA